jgi:hypothetical protein
LAAGASACVVPYFFAPSNTIAAEDKTAAKSDRLQIGQILRRGGKRICGLHVRLKLVRESFQGKHGKNSQKIHRNRDLSPPDRPINRHGTTPSPGKNITKKTENKAKSFNLPLSSKAAINARKDFFLLGG